MATANDVANDVSLDEAYETETGFLDEYDGTITRSYFATDSRYQDGNVLLLHWDITTTDPDVPEVTEKFPIGSGWDSSDGGKTVVNEKGKQKFNKSSIYGKIVDSATSGEIVEVLPVLKSRGRPTVAAIWDGLSFHFKRKEFDYGGEIGVKARVMPIKFLGENAQVQMPTTAAPAAAAADTTSADPLVLARLRVAAKDAASHQAFLDAAMEIDGVTSNDALLATLIDDSATGFYAQNAAAA